MRRDRSDSEKAGALPVPLICACTQMLTPDPGRAQCRNPMGTRGSCALPWREHESETQKHLLSSPLPWQDTEGPGIRCLMIDINPLGFWRPVAVPSAMKVLLLALDVKLFLLDASSLSPLRKEPLQAEITPVTLNCRTATFCLSGINRALEAAGRDGD